MGNLDNLYNSVSMLINLLILYFNNELAPYEIPLFRGAIIQTLDSKSLLSHNHDGDGFRYAYPLIQYKRLDGKAAILCINKGIEDVGELLTSPTFSLKLRSREVEAHINNIVPQTFDVRVSDEMFTYHIENWCPFNENNWRQYNELQGLVERTTFLEHILIGNILSFAKGIGWHINQEVKCKILSISRIRPRNIKGVSMACLDVKVQSNAIIPNYIGLGKHASISYGVIKREGNK